MPARTSGRCSHFFGPAGVECGFDFWLPMGDSSKDEFRPFLRAGGASFSLPSAGKPGRFFLLGFPVVIFAMIGMAVFAALPGWPDLLFFDRTEGMLSRMAQGLVESLRAGDLQGSLAVCAEGPLAQARLHEEDGRVFRIVASPPSSTDGIVENTALREQELSLLHGELKRLGLVWEEARPLALGGICADVRDPATMTRPVSMFVGHVYVASRGTTFAIEISARKAKGDYFITDLWKWQPAQASLDDLRAASEAAFRQFSDDPIRFLPNGRLRDIRYIFVHL